MNDGIPNESGMSEAAVDHGRVMLLALTPVPPTGGMTTATRRAANRYKPKYPPNRIFSMRLSSHRKMPALAIKMAPPRIRRTTRANKIGSNTRTG